ncbi:hypothetical protein FEM48_Zijuj09G0038400 [Ziziphus jujuba var. spinosa]|uniref:FAF domain-containing protein n=1 Tax=Ziziphus jujuba var. spinosa TaxID=714518 RepID=A0A978UQQ9_ZIZJJ|nr:hypothetical protein FEM48_Zijuj09G0038400 [Ziziphus jujuba var. spinosa]
MSSSACQGFQSCLDPPIIEPRVLKLRLTPSKSNLSQSSGSNSKPTVSDSQTQLESQNEQNKVTRNKKADMGGWSFFQALSIISESKKNDAEKEKVYVHPLIKRSSSMLSKRSLEMCTESLGSETGSDVSDTNFDEFSSLSVESEKFPTRQCSKLGEILAAKRLNRSRSFPPPLTSISGSSGIQVRPRREGGRLVLEAVTISSRRTYFHAERSDGRLKLRLLNDSPSSYDNDAEQEEEEEEVEEMGKSFQAEEKVVEADGAENEDEDGDEVYDEENGEMGEEMDGICGNVGGELGIKKLSRPSRCKEGGRGNRGLMNWETFWVAT